MRMILAAILLPVGLGLLASYLITLFKAIILRRRASRKRDGDL